MPKLENILPENILRKTGGECRWEILDPLRNKERRIGRDEKLGKKKEERGTWPSPALVREAEVHVLIGNY